MPIVFSIVSHWMNDEKPADAAVNVVWHTIADGGFNPAVDYDNHASEVAALFHNQDPTHPFQYYQDRNVDVKVYDLADAKPRPERGHNFRAAPSGTAQNRANLTIPQAACVLSFYAGRNLRSQRGHIYIGPFASNQMPATVEIPDSNITGILSLGHGLFDIGGENVAHVVYSRIHNATHVVTDYWVDKSWDVIRSRKIVASARQTLHP